MLTTQFEWAITEEARSLIEQFIDNGLEPDLAFSLAENLLPENTMYNLPKEE